jgi:hypothetical protein
MKYMTLYFIAIEIAFAFYSCRDKKPNETNRAVPFPPGRVLKIFRSTEKVNLFVLRINDDFNYRDSSDKEYSGPWSLIKEYIPAGDSISVYLKIDNRDTSFVYNVKVVDSVLFGRMEDRKKIYIRTNLHEAAWLFD